MGLRLRSSSGLQKLSVANFRFPTIQGGAHIYPSLKITATESVRLFTRSAISLKSSSQIRGRDISVTFEDGKSSQYSAFWLRDHCKCEKCWHPQTKQRLHDTISIKDDIQAASSSAQGDQLIVTWPDGHVSKYSLHWLRFHSYDPPLTSRPFVQKREKILWDGIKAKSGSPPRVPYQEVMSSEKGLADWLKQLDIHGYCFVDGVPVDVKQTEELARRICFIRESHYGGFWDFTSNLAHGDTAYTNLAIGAHTDSTYFTDPVGLQLFHLLKHKGEGGHTLLVDGFHIAHQMKTKYPEHFKTLSSLRLATHSAGDEQILIRPTPSIGFPMIQCDPSTGEVFQIRYNNHDRSALSGKYMNRQQIEAFYMALRVWTELVRDPKNELWLKMQPGQAVIVDNWRVMHGRSSFTGERRLCGAYLNWDDYRSRVSQVVDHGKAKDQL